ncbi:MAG TPA: ATP-binding protein, partial [Roseiflexaceae bacterium]|nr:ATP-binding protein [Roseiflexaceae bacterium]
ALRLLKLVNSLLDFARLEAGRMAAAYVPTDLALLTEELAGVFRSTIEHAGLKLVVACPPLPEQVYVDRDMWETIVFNLLSNAFKFTFEGTIEVVVRQAGTHAELQVRDSGIGIAADELPRLFERFHRVTDARGRTFEGSGIGLALVQELVALHGGIIQVHSTLGQGTTFVVTLPFGSAHLPQHQIGEAPAARSGSARGSAYLEEARRWLPDETAVELDESVPDSSMPSVTGDRAYILLADDNADVRAYIRRLLSPLYHVEAVADGMAALKAAQARRPDLVLADVMMPGMDGFTLLRELRADPHLQTVPVILLSARAGEEARVEGLAARADDYLTKPFSARELLARIAARLELARLRTQLDQERAALATLFSQSPVPIAILHGPQLVFELANLAYTRVVGRNDLVGKPLLQALPETAQQGFAELLHQVMATGEPVVGHETLLRLARRPGQELEDTYWTFIY